MMLLLLGAMLMAAQIGPRTLASQELHRVKYRPEGEDFDGYCVRYARTVADDEKHFRQLLPALRSQATLPGGRQQRAVGWPHQTTAFNCFVGGTIPDDTGGIGDAIKEAMLTLRSGGGCGWDFTPLRWEGAPVKRLGEGARASGPVSFANVWDAACKTILSAGERRGAMMMVLSVAHPDILKFVRCKSAQGVLTSFNISVGITDGFMEALYADKLFALEFDGQKHADVRAVDLWAAIMENNWDWSEPGALFMDRINRMNPLQYCEFIRATNPCAEQPLPPYGACLLLSQNAVKYLVPTYGRTEHGRRRYEVDYDRFVSDVEASVRACDNVFERTVFPLDEYKQEALNKRRMGIGATGVADALAVCGYAYGTPEYISAQDRLLELLRDTAYRTSIDMARRKGPFPLFDADKWLASGFGRTLPDDIRDGIKRYGLRNGLLLSIAPTGTISMAADNVSSGIEPPPAIEATRIVLFPDGPREVEVDDWAFEEHGVRPLTAREVPPEQHVAVLCAAQKYVDSSVSKTTCYAGAKSAPAGPGETTYGEFKSIYSLAYDGGAKGCTTHNFNGKRMGIIRERSELAEGAACEYTEGGARVCG